MGAVEEAQIRAAAAEAGRVAPDDRLPPETVGIVRAVSRLLGMVADDLIEVIEELESADADRTYLAHHALGVVTGAIGVLDGMAPERATLLPLGLEPGAPEA